MQQTRGWRAGSPAGWLLALALLLALAWATDATPDEPDDAAASTAALPEDPDALDWRESFAQAQQHLSNEATLAQLRQNLGRETEALLSAPWWARSQR